MKQKNMYIAISVIVLILLVFVVYALDFTSKTPATYGVTFSTKQAVRLTDDWKQMYRDIVSELPLDHIRLVAYWDDIEVYPGEYYLEDLRFQIEEAQKHDIDVILAVGRRVPRFPECFAPEWVYDFPEEKQKVLQKQYMQAVVEEFMVYDNITHWQVENEFFLVTFGFCSEPDPEFLKEEIALIKNLDDRPILVTDSGELGNWSRIAQYGDVFGATLYRSVWNKHIGDFTWHLPAVFYKFKKDSVHRAGVEEAWIVELQGEPWGRDFGFITDLSIEEQFDQFGLEKFKSNVSYAHKSGFSHVTFWGVEWWHWLKRNGHPEFWEYVKNTGVE